MRPAHAGFFHVTTRMTMYDHTQTTKEAAGAIFYALLSLYDDAAERESIQLLNDAEHRRCQGSYGPIHPALDRKEFQALEPA